jgi:hypothetical protein
LWGCETTDPVGNESHAAGGKRRLMKPSIYWLFVFIPITVVVDHVGKVPPPVIFFSAALAIVPIAVLIVRSTKAGYPGMVRASIIGGILANLLLAVLPHRHLHVHLGAQTVGAWIERPVADGGWFRKVQRRAGRGLQTS